MNKVYQFKKPQKATITLEDDSITIQKHGHFQKLKGANRIPFSSISSMQYREAKLSVNGMLRFTITGNSTLHGLLADDNSILFVKKNAAEVEAIRNFIQNKISSKNEISSSDNVTEEIRKFKALLDDGIISKQEFEEKKKQLLGL